MGYERLTPADFLDPTHPFAETTYRARRPHPSFPVWRDGTFTLRVFPRALLVRPEHPHHIRPPAEIYPSRTRRDGDTPPGMSVSFMTGKAATHKSAVVRHKIRGRIKTALGLIAVRGADVRTDVKGGKQSKHIVFPEGQAWDKLKWVLEDWSYVFVPTLSLYRMPYPDLIVSLRKALQAVNTQARNLGQDWTKGAKVPAKRPRWRDTPPSDPQETLPSDPWDMPPSQPRAPSPLAQAKTRPAPPPLAQVTNSAPPATGQKKPIPKLFFPGQKRAEPADAAPRPSRGPKLFAKKPLLSAPKSGSERDP